MKAIVLHGYGGSEQLTFEEVADPVPASDEVLVRCEATSINPLDYKLRSGAMKAFMPLDFPYIPGLELAGTVIALGGDVTEIRVGDRVFGRARSTYAELCAVKTTEVRVIPEGLDVAQAAALPVVLLTGEQIVRQGADVQAGQTVLVTGAVGGVGRSAVYTGKQRGARVLAGVRGRQVDEAKTVGADEVIALDAEGAMAGLPVLDAVIDLVGGKTAEMLIGKVKAGGVLATSVGGPANAGEYPEVRVQMTQVGSDGPTLERYARAVLEGKLAVPIDRKIALAEAAAGQAAVEKGGIGKVVLLP